MSSAEPNHDKGVCDCALHYIVEKIKVHNGAIDRCKNCPDRIRTEEDKKAYRLGAVTHQASASFAKSLYNEIHVGYGFTPLLGSGFSVSAGIPIIQQLLPYLQRCICVALGVEGSRLPPGDTLQLWNPRSDRWPPLVDRTRPDVNWIDLMGAKVAILKDDNESRDSYSICLEALGAMAEWRTALFFLSRIVFDRPRNRQSKRKRGYVDQQLKPRLAQPSQSVIDAGWREWIRDKRPTVNHRLLATLSGLLRIDTIMTTNFDDLVERAFEASRNPLQVFDVHMLDGLPELSVVSRGRSIIKMHGSVRSLRADYSLDGRPSAEDRRLFAEYLAGRQLDTDRLGIGTGPYSQIPTKKHLLVMGVGASEPRTMAFVTEALRRLHDLKVFWVCYNEPAFSLFVNYVNSLRPSDLRGPDGKPRIHVVRHTDAGLLMLHVYQQIRRTIPPENAIYAATTQLSSPPLPPPKPDISELSEKQQRKQQEADRAMEMRYADFQKRLTDHISVAPPPASPTNHGNPLCVATSALFVSGVTTVCERVFRELESKYVCMWIEMNDVYSIDELFEIIQESAYIKLGQRDWTPLYAADDRRPRDREITRICDASEHPFLAFINARETPGANRAIKKNNSNGWLDEEWAWQQLDDLLREIEFASKGRFKTVILAHDATSPLVTRPLRFVGNIIRLEGIPNNEAPSTVTAVMKWVADVPYKHPLLQKNSDYVVKYQENALHFLHTLAMMQRSRHLALIWARCAGQPNDQYWSDYDIVKSSWIDDLEEMGLVRRKDGGFIWVHSRLRTELRAYLIAPTLLSDVANLRTIFATFSCERRAEIQQNIAFWYLKLFDSTNSPVAIFEAVDHLCSSAAHLIVGAVKCIVGAIKSRPEEGKSDNAPCAGNKAENNLKTARRRIDTAKQLLDEHYFLIFSQGYPRASKRRLDKIVEFWDEEQWMAKGLSEDLGKKSISALLSSLAEALDIFPGEIADTAQAKEKPVRVLQIAIARLCCATSEISIMIAREIGENQKAYVAMHTLCKRMELSPDSYSTGSSPQTIDADRADRQNKGQKWHTRVLKGLQFNVDKQSAVQAWLQWWLRCGLLGIASRSFREAEHSLYRAVSIAKYGELVLPQLQPNVDVSKKDWKDLLGSWDFDYLNGPDEPRSPAFYSRYRPSLYALEEAAYLLVLRAAAERRYQNLFASTIDPVRKKTLVPMAMQAGRHFRLAEWIAIRGLNLIEQIQDSGIDREDHDRHLMGHKSRLLQLAGLASRYDTKRKKNSRHAMSLMGDAVAALNEADPLFAHAEHAVIDLRRAEVRLTEASAIELFSYYPFEIWTLDRLIGPGINVPIEQNADRSGLQSHHPKTQVEIANELKQSWQRDGESQRKKRTALERFDKRKGVAEVCEAEAITDIARDTFQQREIYRIDFGLNTTFHDDCQDSLDRQVKDHATKIEATKNRPNEIAGYINKVEKALEQDADRRNKERAEAAAREPESGAFTGKQKKRDQSGIVRQTMAEVASRAYDAIRFLDRAEPILRDRRRNVNWTTYYFELRLRAISLILWSSIVQEGTPIPYLGLEAAMRLTETEPDRLLDDAARMIRVDSYRMARVVLAYASCARALEIRLALDRSAVRLPERLKQMQEKLDTATRQLEEVIDRRTAPILKKSGEKDPDSKATVLETIDEVVAEILKRVRMVVSGLTSSIGEQTEEQKEVQKGLGPRP